MNVKKILAINYGYLPTKSIGTRRTVNLINNLVEITKAEDVRIISARNKYLEKENAPFIRYKAKQVTTFDINHIQHFRGHFINREKQRAKFAQNEIITDKVLAPSKLTKFQNSLPGVLLLGEGGFIYIISAFLKAQKFIDKNSLIFTSYYPFSDHIVGWLLKFFYPKTIWIADFRDLYLQDGLHNVYGYKTHQYILKKILSRSNLVTTVSEGLAERLKNFSGNVSVLRNGIDLHKISKNNGYISDKFIISYTGALYGFARDPSSVLSAIRNCIRKNKIIGNDIILNYAGTDGAIWDSLINKLGLDKCNLNHGVVSHSEAIQIQKNSCINLVITWSDEKNKGILTGKFFEYIEAGNLILVLIRGDSDKEFENIVNETNVGACFYDNQEALIEKWILNYYRQWKEKGYIEINYDFNALSKLTWSAQIEESIIKKLNIQPAAYLREEK